MVTKSKAESTTSDVAVPEFSAVELREVTSIQDAMLLLQQYGEGVVQASEAIGDGFPLMKDKDRLIGSPLLFLSWTFQEGDQVPDPDNPGHFLEFVAAKVINKSGDKFTIVDGSTGICRQLKDLTVSSGKSKGLYTDRGLRKSEYDLPDGSGGRGTTYYIDTAA